MPRPFTDASMWWKALAAASHPCGCVRVPEAPLPAALTFVWFRRKKGWRFQSAGGEILCREFLTLKKPGPIRK
jgi:hypothetical protein